jgi:hypothetical protein
LNFFKDGNEPILFAFVEPNLILETKKASIQENLRKSITDKNSIKKFSLASNIKMKGLKILISSFDKVVISEGK